MPKEPFNKALIYDDDCPVCKAYSAAFVSSGLLRKENRLPFSKATSYSNAVSGKFAGIDWQRARHEIPLVDLANGEVKYGVEALLDVLGQKISVFNTIINVAWLKALLVMLYRFVSYNRKVIAANYKPVNAGEDASPAYSFFWRYMLIAATWLLSFISTTTLARQVNGSTNSNSGFALFFALMLVVLIPGISKGNKYKADLYAHSGIVYVVGSYLLLMVFYLKNIFQLNGLLFYALIGGVAYIIIRQVLRRTRFIKRSS